MAGKKRKGPHVGVSITDTQLEIAFFDPKTFQISQSHQVALPETVMGENGDKVLDLNQLASIIKSALGNLKPKVKAVNLSLTATLLRMVEMPKMEPQELYLSLSSEAERYKSFDDTEAVVDFHILPPTEGLSPSMNRVVFGAIRSDTFSSIQGAFKAAKIKIASVDIHPLDTLRAMAGTGVLDSLVEQIGPENTWGTVFIEPERVRFSLWKGNSLIDLREVSMDTTEFAYAGPDAPFVYDLVDEIRRTTKNLVPSLWLTQDLPENIGQKLSEQLGVPVRPCVLGNNLRLDQPGISLATVGSAMHTKIEYPFDFDFMTGASQAAAMGKKGAAAAVVEDVEEGPGPTILIVSGAVLTFLALLVWGGLAAFNVFFLGLQVQNLTAEEGVKMNRTQQLTLEMNALRMTSDLRAQVIDVINQARIRNAIYLNLTEDLQSLTPDKVWVYHIEAGDGLALEGKALSHQAVIDFARQFDSLLYARDVIIDGIQEEANGSSILYKFKIHGRSHFNEKLISGETSSEVSEIIRQEDASPGQESEEGALSPHEGSDINSSTLDELGDFE